MARDAAACSSRHRRRDAGAAAGQGVAAVAGQGAVDQGSGRWLAAANGGGGGSPGRNGSTEVQIRWAGSGMRLI